MPTSADLNEQIRIALDQSAHLIVVCSPNSARSRWVGEEILAFKKLGRESRILALITAGEPNASDKPGLTPSQECFPAALKYRVAADGGLGERTEPIAADARPQGDGRENARLKLIAGLLGVGYDTLKQREIEAARRRARIYQSIAASMLVLAIAALVSAYFAYDNFVNAQRQRNDALIAQSRFLARDARRAIERGNVVLGIQLALEALPRRINEPDRPFVAAAERALVDGIANQRERLVLRGHESALNWAGFSPDGSRIVTISEDTLVTKDSTARIWDARAGKTIAVLKGHAKGIVTAAFSPDGKRVVTGSYDSTARLWDADSGRLVAILQNDDAVYHAEFSADGSRIVTTSSGGTARLWRAQDATLVAVLAGHGGFNHSAAFSPDGRRLATAGKGKTLLIWDGTSGAPIRTIRLDRDVDRVSYSPDGARIAVAGGVRGEAAVLDAATGATRARLTGHESWITAIRFSPDGKRVITASRDKTARIWDANTGASLQVLLGHDDQVTDAVFSPDGRNLLTASRDGNARVWYASFGKAIAILGRHEFWVTSAAYDPAGKRILTASRDHTARVWDAEPAATAHVVKLRAFDANSVSFSPDGGRVLVATGEDKSVHVFDASTYEEVATLESDGKIQSARYSPDGARIITAQHKTVRIWDVRSRALLATLPHEDLVLSAEFSPDGKVIASADTVLRLWDADSGGRIDLNSPPKASRIAFSPDGSRLAIGAGEVAHIWDVRARKLTAKLGVHRLGVTSVAFSKDGKQLATGGVDYTVRVWDATTGARLLELPHVSPVSTVAFSPDGAYLATGYWDGAVLLWELRTGRYTAVLRGHGSRVNSVVFSPDGRLLASGADDGTVRIWRVPARCQLAIDAARAALPRPLSKKDREEAFLESSGALAPPTKWLIWALPRAGDTCQ